MFRGIKTSSVNQTANLKSIQGLTTFIGDEMEERQSEEDYDSLILSIRTAGIQNRVILVMNPSDEEHFICQKYIKDKTVVCLMVAYKRCAEVWFTEDCENLESQFSHLHQAITSRFTSPQ